MIVMSDETTPQPIVTEKEMVGIKTIIVLGCIVAIVFLLVCPFIGAYNSLVDSNQQVQRSASNIQTDLERRADLLPNLAAEVKGSATFESKTLIAVTEARAGQSQLIKSQLASSQNPDVASMSAKDEQLTNILGNFVKLQEQYPELQSTKQFVDLEAQTTATENEILVDRQTYNAAVMQYRSVCLLFPTNLVANQFGFNADRYQMYIPANQTRAETVPDVTFDFSKL
jgi:LemA protein